MKIHWKLSALDEHARRQIVSSIVASDMLLSDKISSIAGLEIGDAEVLFREELARQQTEATRPSGGRGRQGLVLAYQI